jgi:hypothetical protein
MLNRDSVIRQAKQTEGTPGGINQEETQMNSGE